MKLAILSDTHGLLRPEVTEHLKTADAILHGGDINRQSIVDELRQYAPLYIVRGNNDKEWAEDILFPLGFPERCPVVSRWIRKKPVQMNHVEWDYSGNIFKSFVQYYTNL